MPRCYVCGTKCSGELLVADMFPVCIREHQQKMYRETIRHQKLQHNESKKGRHPTLRKKQWLITLEHFNYKCVYCGGSFQNVDHYIPLSQGGLTAWDNCFPSCISCNLKKDNWLPEQIHDIFPEYRLAKIESFRQYVSTQSETIKQMNLPEIQIVGCLLAFIVDSEGNNT